MFCCSSRDDGKKANSNANRNDMHPQPGQMPPAHHTGKPVGVGIVFQPDSTGALHVKSLAVGGPAEKCGLVSVGDVLHEIDGHHVYRKPVAQLAPLILGQEGTVVRLGLQRGNLQRLVFVRSPLAHVQLLHTQESWEFISFAWRVASAPHACMETMARMYIASCGMNVEGNALSLPHHRLNSLGHS